MTGHGTEGREGYINFVVNPFETLNSLKDLGELSPWRWP